MISEVDNGIYDALNKGIKISTGDIIGFLHADDFFPNSFVLSEIVEAFSSQNIDAIYGDLNYVSRVDDKKVIRQWMSSGYKNGCLKLGWMPPHPTLYVRRHWYNKISGFDTDYMISADYKSVLELFLNKKFTSTYINKVLVVMRLGGTSNKSVKNICRKTKEDWKALRSVGFGYCSALIALILKNFRKIKQFL